MEDKSDLNINVVANAHPSSTSVEIVTRLSLVEEEHISVLLLLLPCKSDEAAHKYGSRRNFPKINNRMVPIETRKTKVV